MACGTFQKNQIIFLFGHFHDPPDFSSELIFSHSRSGCAACHNDNITLIAAAKKLIAKLERLA